MDGWIEAGREGGREGGRGEGGREAGRQGERECAGGRQGGREAGRRGGREEVGGREAGRKREALTRGGWWPRRSDRGVGARGVEFARQGKSAAVAAPDCRCASSPFCAVRIRPLTRLS